MFAHIIHMVTTNMIELLLPSLLAGLGIAIIAGPLGSFVVWRRMAYFGDTLAHASLLGLALGFLLDINLYLALLVCCLGMAAILVAMQKQKLIATDTLLGIMAHSALSLGMIAVSFLDNVRIDLMSYLFGDLLAISPSDLTFIWFGVVTVSLIVYLLWQPLLSTSVNEELAFVEGTNTDLMRLILMLLIGLVIAVGMKFVGGFDYGLAVNHPRGYCSPSFTHPRSHGVLGNWTGCIKCDRWVGAILAL